MIQVRSRRMPATGSAGGPELVLWPGWGFGAAAWSAAGPGWLEALRQMGPVTLLEVDDLGEADLNGPLWEALLDHLPQRAVWLGWSLGGMLAAELAARHPHRCQALFTVASNASFVARPDWPWAMPEQQFEAFRARMETAPERTWRRFLTLCVQHGGTAEAGRDHRAWLALLHAVQPRPLGNPSSCAGPPGDSPILRGLDWLALLDTRRALAQLRCPVQHWLAEDDALVPARVAPALARLNSRSRVRVLQGVHALHLSSGELLAGELRTELRAIGLVPPQRDKRSVAEAFGRAAARYDTAAHLQRRVSRQLQAWLPTDGGQWLDLGCGTGSALPALSLLDPSPLAVDLAEGMVRFGQSRFPVARWLCGDAEQLPLADHTVDGVFSSLALQWCDNLQAVCRELARVLRPTGRVLIATLGPATLASLRQAWAQVDDGVHVNRFACRGEWTAALAAAGLVAEHWEERSEILFYDEFRSLARELKTLGANNVNHGRPRGLTGRQQWLRLQQALETVRTPQGLPAEYQVWYLMLRRSGRN